MSSEDWDTDFVKAAGVFLNGSGIQGRDSRGERITDDNVLLFFNASDADVEFTIPGAAYAADWSVAIDTAERDHPGRLAADAVVTAVSRSVLVLVAGNPPSGGNPPSAGHQR
jgi:isoamylase